jgi:hypothetical protein
MKKLSLSLFIFLTLLAGTGTFAVPLVTHADTTTTSSNSCWSWTSPSSWLTCSAEVAVLAPVAAITFLFLTLASVLTWVSGVLLNLALYNGVVNFAAAIGGTAGIGVGWGVLRDVGNIVLIFGFVFIGIATILGLENYGVKKALPQLLLFAILLNFSLFVSQAVIDTSNLFSVAIYSSINTGASSCQGITSQSQAGCFLNEGLAGAVGTATKIGTLFDLSTFSSFINNPSQTSIAMIMATLLLLITATVFFAAAVMLIIRIIVLVFLMVTSPIGFAGMVLPPLHKYAEQWWHMLLAQSFFVPVYLLLTLIGLKVGEGVASVSGANGSLMAALTQTNGGSTGIFFTFAIIIGFMVAALIIAKNMGAMGAEFAIKSAGSFAFGTSSYFARRTGGRGANYLSEALRGKRQGTRLGRTLGKLSGTEYGRILRGVTDKAAKGSLDARGNALFKAAGLDLGKPNKTESGGFVGIKKAAEEDREHYAEEIGLSKEQKEALDAIKRSIDEQTAAQKAERAPLERDIAAQKAVVAAATGEAKKEEQAKLTSLLLEQADMKDKHKEASDALKATQKEAENAAKRDYIRDLNTKRWYKPFTVAHLADPAAAGKIEKKMKATEADRLAAAMDAATRAVGSASAAPAAAPRGGGGGH